MPTDLLRGDNNLAPLLMPGGDILYARHFVLPSPPETLLARLLAETPWRGEEIVMWGKRRLQPRLIAWYGDPGTSYTYSGLTLDPLAWTPLLHSIKERVEQAANTEFNSVLLNYYRNNRDSIGMHSDDEAALGPRPTIASISLGQERTLVFKPKRSTAAATLRLPLASGSLLLMQGETQRNWQHGINKVHRPCGPRINLTFRLIQLGLLQGPSRAARSRTDLEV